MRIPDFLFALTPKRAARRSSSRRRPLFKRPLLEVLEDRRLLSGVTWQQQSNFDGQSQTVPVTRSLRGLALSSDGSELYAGFIQGTGSNTERTIGISSTVNSNFVSPNAINPAGAVSGGSGVLATTGNLGLQPKGVATDNRGYVYMTLSNSNGSKTNEFGVFNSDLSPVGSPVITTGFGNSAAPVSSQLGGLAVQQIGSNYYLYVAHNKGASTIERWNVTNPADPVLDTSWAGGAGYVNLQTLTGSSSAYPNGLAVGADGTLYVAGGVQAAGTGGNTRGDSVFEISADGTTLLAENTNVPGAMGVALFGGHVYVTEYGNVTDNGDSTTSMPIEELNEPDLLPVQTLTITSGTGNIQAHINGTTSSATDSGLAGIAISTGGQIYVVDQQYDTTSNFPFQYDQILVSSPLDQTPPLVNNVLVNGSATPSPIEYSPASTVTVTATVDDSTTGGSTIASAGFTLDGGATVYPMTVVGSPTNNGETENVTATVNLAALGITTVGMHTIVVQGTDTAGNTGYSSPPISFTVNSIPAQLAVTTEPPLFVAANQGFGLTVTAENSLGYLAPGFTGSETLALASGPAGGTLGGLLVVNAVGGVANFSGLTLNQVGSGYTIQATTTGLTSSTSDRITVVSPATPFLALNSASINYATTFQPGGVPVENPTGVTIASINTISGASIQITNLSDGSNESLTVNTGVTGIMSFYNAANGTLTLSGSATIATYESVLETVTYNDVAASPNTSTRNIQFMLTDSMNVKSNVAVATVSFVGSYTEATGPGSTQAPNVDTVNPTIIIDPLGVVNVPTVTSATVTISSGFVSTEDVLALSSQFQQNFHITLSSPAPGEIVLTGTAQTTAAQYQIELDNITYTNTSHYFPPSDLSRTFTFTVSNGSSSSVSDVKNYTIVPVNTNPTVTTTSLPLSYTALSGPQLIDPGVTVTDPDPLPITSATVSISSGFFTGQDTLSETVALPGGVSALYNSSTGVLTLTGSASLAQYQTLLQGVAYTNSGLNLSPRTISFVVFSNTLSSNVTGNNQRTKAINMVSATSVSFDFNNGSASTAPGFLGVGPSRGYSQSVGYGFSDAVSNFTPFTAAAVLASGVNGSPITSTYAPMYEDGLVSSTNSPQYFTISTTVGTKYDLRVYVGNPNVSLGGIQVTVYTGSITNLMQTQIGQMTGITTTAGGNHAFAAVEIDSLTAGGVTTAAGSEITIAIKSTTGSVYTEGLDFALTGHLPGIAHQDPAGGVAPVGSPPVPALTMSQLQPVVSQAIADWAAAGVTPAQVAALQSTQFVITNLESDGALALTGSNTVQIDSTADGYGWFVDPAVADSPAAGQMDLLTVVTHELGHILGLPDVSASALPNDLMDTELPTGVRRLPSAADIAALATGLLVPAAASAPATSSAAVVSATSPSPGATSVGATLPDLDQALVQTGAPISNATDDDDMLDDSESAETPSAQDGFFNLLG